MPAPSPASLACCHPTCGAKAKVRKGLTRYGGEGAYVRRYYECEEGHRFTTIEVPSMCVNGSIFRKYVMAIIRGVRNRGRTLFVIRHPDWSNKKLARKFKVTEAVIENLRRELRRPSRLTPPKEMIDDED